MNKLVILLLYFLLTVTAFPYTTTGQVLDPAMIGSYIDRFNMQDKELYVQHISNGQAKEFLSGNIPLFECPLVDFPETFEKDTGRVHRNRIPSGCPVGRKAQRHLLPCLVPLSGRQVAEVFRFTQRLCVLLAEGRR